LGLNSGPRMKSQDYNRLAMIGFKLGVPELLVLMFLFGGLLDLLLIGSVILWKLMSATSSPY